MKVTRIDHASVNTGGKLEDTRRFYADVLGLESASRPDMGVDGYWFQAGTGSQVHLIEATPLGAGIDPIGNHYCLTVNDLAAALDELEDAGVEHLKIGDGPEAQVFVTDPAGNTVELQQER
jgi:catechol 2,3-dioxygenase-like lactoylglutathione lyase family enzyme